MAILDVSWLFSAGVPDGWWFAVGRSIADNSSSCVAIVFGFWYLELEGGATARTSLFVQHGFGLLKFDSNSLGTSSPLYLAQSSWQSCTR